MFHGLDLTATDTSCRLGGQAESVGQPEWRPQRGLAGDPAALRLRDPEARSQRPNAQVGDTKSPCDLGGDRPSLLALSTAVRQARRLRALRGHLRANVSR